MPKDPICGMTVGETAGLKATLEGKIYYFCGEHCLETFIASNPGASRNTEEAAAKTAQAGADAGQDRGEHCAACEVKGGTVTRAAPFYKNKNFIVSSLLASAAALSYAVPQLEAFRRALGIYFEKIWWAVLLGLALGGVIDRFVPREYISKILARRRKRTVFAAVALGFLMSACSHGILALSIQLYKKGAAAASVVSFLLASPWANMAMTVMLVGFFGVNGVYIIIAAGAIAVTTGLIFQKLENAGLVEKNPHEAAASDDFSIAADIKRRWRSYSFTIKNIAGDAKGAAAGAVALADMVLWWILIGMGISSAVAAYAPAHLFHNYFGPTMAGLLATLAVATVIEVCSEGSAPMAFEIYRQTGAIGNSFVFLMAGVATDYTEVGLIWTNIGKKAAIWLVAVTLPQVILLGYLANVLLRAR